MLDKNIKITNNRYSSTTCVHPEKIDLNIKRIEEQSFFKEINRNTDNYKKLLQENPVLLEKYYYRFSADELSYMCYPWQQKDKLCGGESRVREIPVKVLAIQYSGNDNFIFELIKI